VERRYRSDLVLRWPNQDHQGCGEFPMNMSAKLCAVALLAASTWSLSAPAGAAPITAPLSVQNAMSSVETVQWRGWGPGLAAGLIIGGAIAASQYPYYGYGYGPYPYGYGYYAPAPVYAAPPVYGAPAAPGYVAGPAPAGDAVAYCSRRYRSYDPASGTFLGYDGVRHPCP
jgi:hypothetical protein